MIILDAFIRFSGIGLLILLAVIALRDYRKWQGAPYLVLTCISVGAAFWGFAPPEHRISGWPFVVVRLMDIPHLVFIWLFALSLFDKDFRLTWKHVLIGLLYSAPILWSRFYDLAFISEPPAWLDPFVSVLSILLILHLCYVTLKGRADDLLDKRRASRIYFVVILLFVTVVAAVSEPLLPPDVIPTETFKIISIWPAIVWGVYWMTSFNQTAVTFGDDRPIPAKMSERDKELRSKLDHHMVDQQAFKDSNLTIVSLARQLGVSQHRLRGLINQSLGYPNFSAYINSYRIDAVKDAFSDPKNAHIPILTIALDSGFKSLSPFNRAFKLSEKKTPTEYRKALRIGG